MTAFYIDYEILQVKPQMLFIFCFALVNLVQDHPITL